MVRVRASRPNGLPALVAVPIIVVATLLIWVPYYALEPGPTQDVGHLISIEGAETTPVNGQLLLTTVSLHKIRIAEAVRGWFDPSIAILSRSAIVPPGESEREVQQRTTTQMQESHILAAAAALRLLGHEVKIESMGARVRGVSDGVPAAETLRRGDVVVGADGETIHRTEDLRAIIMRHKVGDTIGLKIVRGDQTLDVITTTVGRPEDPSDPIIGLQLEDVPQVRLPLAVQIESLGIGGPSAGLMFAVGIYDLIHEIDLAGGRIIAGTGEIDIDGNVRPVGGIRQKVESARRVRAELFLVPASEIDQACRVANGMPVVGVDSLKEAVDALEGARGATVRSCP